MPTPCRPTTRRSPGRSESARPRARRTEPVGWLGRTPRPRDRSRPPCATPRRPPWGSEKQIDPRGQAAVRPPIADEDPGRPFSGRARFGGERSREAATATGRPGARRHPALAMQLGWIAARGASSRGRPSSQTSRRGRPGKYAGRVFGLMENLRRTAPRGWQRALEFGRGGVKESILTTTTAAVRAACRRPRRRRPAKADPRVPPLSHCT